MCIDKSNIFITTDPSTAVFVNVLGAQESILPAYVKGLQIRALYSDRPTTCIVM